MELEIHPTAEAASASAAACLVGWLREMTTRTAMLAGGNSPIDVYRRVAGERLSLDHLTVFALDEYVGVPPDEPRTVAGLLRREVAEAWSIPPERFFTVSPLEADAAASVEEHEHCIRRLGGLDVVVLGVGPNGHLGFNEPGSPADSRGRVVPLDESSVEANRRWFGGDCTPAVGVTVGLATVLGARRALVLAYGSHKAAAVKDMLEGPESPRCPASFLRGHPDVRVFLDEGAAARLEHRGGGHG